MRSRLPFRESVVRAAQIAMLRDAHLTHLIDLSDQPGSAPDGSTGGPELRVNASCASEIIGVPFSFDRTW